MKLLLIAALTLVMLIGCNATPAQIAQWKADLSFAQDQITTLRGALTEHAPGSGTAMKIEGLLAKLGPVVAGLSENIKDAESGGDVIWGLGETLLKVAAGFFPPLAILAPIIGGLKRTQKRVFESVEKGGGLVNPAAAKDFMLRDLKAYAVYKKWSAANGG